MNALSPLGFFLLAPAKDPFAEVQNFLTDKVITGFLGIATPVAVLAFIALGIGAMMSTDEHSRQKFKSGLWWTGLAAALCFLAQNIVPWLKTALGAG